MREIKGNIFNLMQEDFDAFCITSNGMVKKNGACVMGRGIAQTCRDRFSGIDKRLGTRINETGNHVYQLGRYQYGRILSFPVKHHWREQADVELIQRSCFELEKLIDEKGYNKVLLPRPGCGNGGLNWSDVKPQIMTELSNRVFVVTF